MLWYALIFGFATGGLAFLFTRSLRRALQIGGAVLIAGTALALLLVYSGLMGG